jgi:hypothetical protein
MRNFKLAIGLIGLGLTSLCLATPNLDFDHINVAVDNYPFQINITENDPHIQRFTVLQTQFNVSGSAVSFVSVAPENTPVTVAINATAAVKDPLGNAFTIPFQPFTYVIANGQFTNANAMQQAYGVGPGGYYADFYCYIQPAANARPGYPTLEVWCTEID